MNMLYKEQWNDFAYQQMNKPIPVPDNRLCIGESERLSSVPLLLFTNLTGKIPKAVLEKPSQVSVEKYGLTGSNMQVSDKDFYSERFFEDLESIGG